MSLNASVHPEHPNSSCYVGLANLSQRFFGFDEHPGPNMSQQATFVGKEQCTHSTLAQVEVDN